MRPTRKKRRRIEIDIDDLDPEEKQKLIVAPKLPNKPSQLIRLALADLTAVEKKKSYYRVDMNIWHGTDSEPLPEPRCVVCFAGAVIAMAGNRPGLYLEPGHFPANICRKLAALESFRTGSVGEGLQKIVDSRKIPLMLQSLDVVITEYDTNKKQFKRDMIMLANMLAVAGF